MDTQAIIAKLRGGNEDENKAGGEGDGDSAERGQVNLLPSGLTEEDEALVQRTKFKSQSKLNQPLPDSDSDSGMEDVGSGGKGVKGMKASSSSNSSNSNSSRTNGLPVPLVVVSRKRKLDAAPEKPKEALGALGMLAGYGSDSD